MKDEIADNGDNTGKKYAQLVVFIIVCIPVVLCMICFGLAGWTYIAEGGTDFMDRLLVVGSILGVITLVSCLRALG